jgi:hypothetical protein
MFFIPSRHAQRLTLNVLYSPDPKHSAAKQVFKITFSNLCYNKEVQCELRNGTLVSSDENHLKEGQEI